MSHVPDTGKLNAAAEVASGLGKQLQAVLTVAEALRDIRDLEQARVQAIAAANDAFKACQQNEDSLAILALEIQNAKIAVEKAKALAEKASRDATTAAVITRQTANATAKRIVANAETRAREIEEQTKERLDDLERTIARNQQTYDALMVKIAEAEAQLAEIKRRL